MSGRHATGPWIRVTTAAALEQIHGSLLDWVDGIREYLTPEPPAAAPATAIAGPFPRVAGPTDAPHRRGVVDRAAAGLNPAAAPIDRILLDKALADFRAEVLQGLVSHAPHTARSHINAGS